jgi:DNA-binding beta-propeller fold protein YncE
MRWWLTWLTVAVVAVGAGLLIRARRETVVTTDPGTGELGRNFRFDVSDLKRLDPSLLMGRERAPVPALVESPHALAVDEADRLIVGGKDEIAVIETNGVVRSRIPVPFAVRCVTIEEDGALYVGHTDHVGVYHQGGQAPTQWPSLGSNAVLTSIATAGETVFVADAGNRVIWRMDKTGKVLGRIGDKSEGYDGFVIPSPHFDLAIGSVGELWVVDPGRHTLTAFGSDGRRRSVWGQAGMAAAGFSGCCNPTDIAIRSDGSFVTSEKGLVRVKLYTPAGELLGVLAGPEQFDEDVRGLDLAVDRAGRIMVLDPARGQVRVFEVKGTERSWNSESRTQESE